jgi:hypothetical protein
MTDAPLQSSRGSMTRLGGCVDPALAIRLRRDDSHRDLPGEVAMSGVRIVKIAAVPLLGESPKGGWSAEIRREDSIHALIAVHTDAGIIGHGSVFTDGRLVEAGLKVLEPLFRGENALEPERVS